MEKNKKILEEWDNDIKDYPKMNFIEAKELYTKIINCSDDTTKKEMRDKLILSTLYVVVKFIEKNGLLYLNGCSYDTSDIINICNKIWIEKLDSGVLLKVESFAKIFDNDFYSRINNEMDITMFYDNGLNDFMIVFDIYLERKINDLEFNATQLWECVLELILKKRGIFQTTHYFSEERISRYCELFDGIIASLELDSDNIEISRRKLINLRHALISNGIDYLRKSTDDLVEADVAEQVVYDESIKVVRDMLFDSSYDQPGEYITPISDKEKEVIKLRYGFIDGYGRTLDEVGKQFNISRNRVRQIEVKAIKKLRHPSRSKKFKDIL